MEDFGIMKDDRFDEYKDVCGFAYKLNNLLEEYNATIDFSDSYVELNVNLNGGDTCYVIPEANFINSDVLKSKINLKDDDFGSARMKERLLEIEKDIDDCLEDYLGSLKQEFANSSAVIDYLLRGCSEIKNDRKIRKIKKRIAGFINWLFKQFKKR